MTTWWPWLLVAYACGSVPFGLLLARTQGIDIRRHGSGNIGATNVGRVLGKKWGGLCFFLDVLKGTTPTLVAGLVLGYAGRSALPATDAWRWLAIGALAMVGHVFPIWLGFKGGKGVATGLGVLLGFWPLLTLAGAAGLVTWLLFASTFRYVSLASIVAAAAIPCYVALGTVLRGQPVAQAAPFLWVTGLMGLLAIVLHRGNIKRLLAGTESQLGRPRHS